MTPGGMAVLLAKIDNLVGNPTLDACDVLAAIDADLAQFRAWLADEEVGA